MKKQIKHIFSLMILVSAFTACTSESISEVTSVASQTNGVPFTLKLTNKDKINSRGTYVEKSGEGESDKNENLINHADIFFYTDADGDAVYKFQYNPDSAEDKEAEIKGTIPTDVIDVLFNGTNKCIAYAVVNGPVTPDEGVGTSIANLKAIEIEATFDTELTEECFVMDGQSTEITYGNNTVSGTIELYRAAAKIQLYINELTDYVDDAGNTWSPQKGTDTEFPITVEFYNGTKKSQIDWGNKAISLESAGYFDIADDASRALTGNDTNGYTHDPFYSYPSSWSSDGDANEAYLYLRIYWAKTKKMNSDGTLASIEDPRYEPYYYRVPINLEGDENNNYAPCQLTRNTFYKININVGVLGDSKKNTGKTTLEPTYTIVDWKTIDIEAELSDYHYLVVEKDFVEVFNENTVTIGYTACDDVKSCVITSLTRPYFSDNDNDGNYTTTFYNNTTGTSKISADTNGLLSTCSVEINDKNIVLSHPLINDINQTDFDYVPYTIKLKIELACGLSEEIEIIQYPAMYAVAYANSGNSNNNGYVYVNGNNSGSRGNYDHVMKPDGVNDYNMYVITTTAFQDNTYVIGDPRTNHINNLLSYGSNWTTTVKDTDGTSRQLTFYYPTEGTGLNNFDHDTEYTNDRTENMVSPQFRMSSSWGVSDSYSDEGLSAVKRCATYQEDQYPAGRWRLPTKAEILYVKMMQTKGYIPELYNLAANYWSANGLVNGTGSGTGAGANYVRCVYDEWYWSNYQTATPGTYIWGDETLK